MSNKKENTEKKILVLGATGKTGSRVLQQLTKLGYNTRAGSRSANLKFDWTDDATWKPALENIDAVYITFQPDLALPGAADAIRLFTKTAMESGVKQLVLLAGRNEEEAQKCEQVVMDSGVDWTIVRVSFFSQNFSEGFFLEPVLAGHLAFPAGDVTEPFIDVDDIANVAVAALTGEGHNGEIYELTGPRLLTFKNATEEISRVTGKPISYEQISVAEYGAILTEQGVPDDYVKMLTYVLTDVLDGRSSNTTNGVERAIGRKATDFSEYVRKTAATGVWNKP